MSLKGYHAKISLLPNNATFMNRPPSDYKWGCRTLPHNQVGSLLMRMSFIMYWIKIFITFDLFFFFATFSLWMAICPWSLNGALFTNSTDYRTVGWEEGLCHLRRIAAHRDHFVWRLSFCLSVCLSVCLSGSHTFLVVIHSYVLQATHAFLRMLPLCFLLWKNATLKCH